MRKYNKFSRCCQYKNSNSSVIITPSVFYTNQLLFTYNLAAKHIVVLCYFLLSCWREQSFRLDKERPTLDSMLSLPLKAKMIELDYNSIGKVLSLTKLQTKNIIVDLEKARLVRRVLIKNQWYILLLDQAFKMYLNNNKSKKHRINKGNIIPTSWLSALKADTGQTDFTGALFLGEITYFSRVFKRKKLIDDLPGCDEFDSNKQSTIEVCQQRKLPSLAIEEQQLIPSSGDSLKFGDQNCNDTAIENEANVVLVSKSKGLIAYFEHDHFKKKFPFLSSKVIERTLSRLEKNNIISIERKKFLRNRKVIKRLYITLNYDLIQKGVNNAIVDFIFKTDDYLNKEQLADFCQNTPPFIYNKYNNKTIIYPRAGFSSNFISFSSFSKIICFSTSHLTKPLEQISSKKWYQVSYHDRKLSHNHTSNANSKMDKSKLGKYDKISYINHEESYWSKKRAFKLPRYFSEMQSSLKRHYRAYFSLFDYPLSFCYQLLDSLAKKYPGVSFRGENQFINYFRKILSQEKRASWQVRSRQYFQKAKFLSDLVYNKLPSCLKEKLNKLATQLDTKIEELPALLAKLAIRNTKHLFSCASSFLSYMKQVLYKLKSKEEIQAAYKALPRTSIGEVASYLSKVEASYHRVGPQEHLRRKLASTLPMTIAYHLLQSCNFYSTKVDVEKNFIIPSNNKNWTEMLRGGIKNIIKDQVMAVYGTIKAIKFVQVLRKEKAAKKPTKGDDALSLSTTVRWAIKTVSKSTNAQRSSYHPESSFAQDKQSLSYYSFHQRRLRAEQREKEESAARIHKEEQKLKANCIDPAVYEKYKQVIKEAEIEKQSFISKWGNIEQAKEMFKVPSFEEWLELQELIAMT